MMQMGKRKKAGGWAGIVARNMQMISRVALRASRKVATQVVKRAVKPAREKQLPPRGAGDWIAGVALGAAGARRYHLYRPAGVTAAAHPPLVVMLHGCGQDGKSFAISTRMNTIAARERFLVLYPEQERLANAQGCWNWFQARSGRAQGEADLLLAAIDQACVLYGADRERVALCGISAGASMAALVGRRHPDRFKAVVMHSGVSPDAARSGAAALAAMQGRRSPAPLGVAPPHGVSPAAPLPPLLVIQGDLDHVVVPSNARAAVLAWVHAGDASDHAVLRETLGRRVQRGKRHAMRVVDFSRRGRIVATLVEVEGLGHAWSGGLAGQPFSDASGPDASRMAWAFAAKQFSPASR
jgi:poly(hydroxyalkanoate) depolymerase family esterase